MSPKDVPAGDPNWQQCKEDVDCMELRGHCNTPLAIHKRYEDLFRAYKRKSEKDISCSSLGPVKWPEDYQVSCISKRCTIVDTANKK